MESAVRLRPLGVGDLLDETIRLYRSHFLHLVTVAAVTLVPATLLLNAAQVLALPLGGGGSRNSLAFAVVSAVSAAAFGLAYVVGSAALTLAISEAILGRRLRLRAAYARGLRRLWAIVGLGMLVSVALVVMFLVFPVAIYFSVCWALAYQVLLVEDTGIRRALSRSRALVRGRWWRTLGILTLIGLFTGAISLAFSLPGIILTGVAVLLGPSAMIVATVVNALFSAAGQVLVVPVQLSAFVLLYYDLRVRQEGLDLELRVAEVSGGG